VIYNWCVEAKPVIFYAVLYEIIMKLFIGFFENHLGQKRGSAQASGVHHCVLHYLRLGRVNKYLMRSMWKDA
jgi:hypothetical protein